MFPAYIYHFIKVCKMLIYRWYTTPPMKYPWGGKRLSKLRTNYQFIGNKGKRRTS